MVTSSCRSDWGCQPQGWTVPTTVRCPPPPRRPPIPPSYCLRGARTIRASPSAGSSDTTPGRPSGPGSWATTPPARSSRAASTGPSATGSGSPRWARRRSPSRWPQAHPQARRSGRSWSGSARWSGCPVVAGIVLGVVVAGAEWAMSARSKEQRAHSTWSAPPSPHRPPVPPSRPRDRFAPWFNVTRGGGFPTRDAAEVFTPSETPRGKGPRTPVRPGCGLSVKAQYPPTGSAGSVTRSKAALPDSSVMIGRLVMYP